ncbi:hypothetical protein [Mycobacterium sp.]|uniref:hypothetical protein n=1 Tax=Mycobacterium sp. TaxID=1785 RepID=UPI003F990A39
MRQRSTISGPFARISDESTRAQPLQPGPHSAIADIKLPEGTVPCTSSGCRTPPEHEEVWRYNAPYEDVVEFLRNQFGTGPYDDLPPCPPAGPNDGPEWKWSNDARWLAVAVSKPGPSDANGDTVPFRKIYIACGPVHPADQGRCHPAYSHG